MLLPSDGEESGVLRTSSPQSSQVPPVVAGRAAGDLGALVVDAAVRARFALRVAGHFRGRHVLSPAGVVGRNQSLSVQNNSQRTGAAHGRNCWLWAYALNIHLLKKCVKFYPQAQF